jgi:hypothetical protein
MNLKEDTVYRTTAPINVCFYDADDCLLTDDINLPVGTLLTYVGPDADDGEVFTNSEGTKFCLHSDDLNSVVVVE